MKKNNGAITEPLVAREAAIAPNIGRIVNQNTGSPIPASGPIIPTFTPWIAASSIAAPLAFSSSKARVTPKIGAAIYGWVLKNSKCLFKAAAASSLFGYNFFNAGINE